MNESILKVINEVKSVRTEKNSAWIFNENGEIKADVFVVDVLPLLYAMAEREAEIILPEDYFDDYDKIENTYNYNCNISNDILYRKKDRYVWIEIHLIGDARANYSDGFIIDIGDYDDLWDYLFAEYDDKLYDYKDINEKYYANYNILNEGVEIYNANTGDYITTVYDVELSEILKEIEK